MSRCVTCDRTYVHTYTHVCMCAVAIMPLTGTLQHVTFLVQYVTSKIEQKLVIVKAKILCCKINDRYRMNTVNIS